MSMKINTIIQGDCIKVMRTWPDNCIDSIVTDPPYGLGFMGKKWDTFNPGYIKAKTKNHKHIDHKNQTERSASMSVVITSGSNARLNIVRSPGPK